MVRPGELASLCQDAMPAGPSTLGALVADDGRQWPIAVGGPAWADAQGEPVDHQPIITLPVKLATLAAAQLGAVGTLLGGPPILSVGITPICRSVVEACSTVMWLLDDEVDGTTRRSRAWLLWAISEGEAARTADRDGGSTGAMSGSPKRLSALETTIEERLGVPLARSGHPKDWKLNGQGLPGRAALTASAVDRWFPGADGRIFYSQVSRKAHSDVLVSLALVDNHLALSEGDDPGVVATVLACWGMSWSRVLSYLGFECEPFSRWRTTMLDEVAGPT